MKSACFMIMVLLASVISNAASRTVHEAASSIPASLGRGLNGFFARKGGIWASTGKRGVQSGINTGDTTKMGVGVRAQKGKHVVDISKACMTEEYCYKKKVICSKKCINSVRGIEKNHIPEKCIVKCKKCIPNC